MLFEHPDGEHRDETFTVRDLSLAMRLTQRLCTSAKDAPTRLTLATTTIKGMLRAECGCIFESRGRATAMMTELHRDQWRDWQTDELSKDLTGKGLRDLTKSCAQLSWSPSTAANKVNWHCLVSCLPADTHYFLTLAFARRVQPFSSRENALLRAMHQSPVGELLGERPKIVVASELNGRLREVLTALLRGKSEKEVASRLSLSHHTIHCYVKSLYRRYGVNSRAELLSLAIDPRSQNGQDE